MTCVVTEVSANKWRGRFSGVWHAQPFSYDVDFSRALIDGADYEWAGKLTKGPGGTFKRKFGGSRYTGYFTLKLRPGR